MSKVKIKPLAKAKVGDTITFNRNDRAHEGVVYKVNENSVLVEISKDSQINLRYENRNTVVSHMNYRIVLNQKVVNK